MKIILVKRITGKRHQVNSSGWKESIYLLTIRHSGFSYSKKIIKN